MLIIEAENKINHNNGFKTNGLKVIDDRSFFNKGKKLKKDNKYDFKYLPYDIQIIKIIIAIIIFNSLFSFLMYKIEIDKNKDSNTKGNIFIGDSI